MSNNTFDENNSHYLNQENRILTNDNPDEWGQLDADFNIKIGNTFGSKEEETLSKQGWRG